MVQARKNNSDTIEPRFLLNAYANGFFPMADATTGAIDWYSPDPRAIIELNRFRVSRSLRQRIRKGTFEVRIDTPWRNRDAVSELPIEKSPRLPP